MKPRWLALGRARGASTPLVRSLEQGRKPEPRAKENPPCSLEKACGAFSQRGSCPGLADGHPGCRVDSAGRFCRPGPLRLRSHVCFSLWSLRTNRGSFRWMRHHLSFLFLIGKPHPDQCHLALNAACETSPAPQNTTWGHRPSAACRARRRQDVHHPEGRRDAAWGRGSAGAVGPN